MHFVPIKLSEYIILRVRGRVYLRTICFHRHPPPRFARNHFPQRRACLPYNIVLFSLVFFYARWAVGKNTLHKSHANGVDWNWKLKFTLLFSQQNSGTQTNRWTLRNTATLCTKKYGTIFNTFDILYYSILHTG